MSSDRSLVCRMQEADAGIFLIGLGLIALLGLDFWPWILVPIAIDSGLETLSSGAWRALFSTAFWVIGLTALFLTDLFWPGIIILVGLNWAIEALFDTSKSADKAEKSKRKRALADDGELPKDFDEMSDEEKSLYFDDLEARVTNNF